MTSTMKRKLSVEAQKEQRRQEGEAWRTIRQRIGLTLREAAGMVGHDYMTLWRWEAGALRIPAWLRDLVVRVHGDVTEKAVDGLADRLRESWRAWLDGGRDPARSLHPRYLLLAALMRTL